MQFEGFEALIAHGEKYAKQQYFNWSNHSEHGDYIMKLLYECGTEVIFAFNSKPQDEVYEPYCIQCIYPRPPSTN
jgi:hypothetical protein